MMAGSLKDWERSLCGEASTRTPVPDAAPLTSARSQSSWSGVKAEVYIQPCRLLPGRMVKPHSPREPRAPEPGPYPLAPSTGPRVWGPHPREHRSGQGGGGRAPALSAGVGAVSHLHHTLPNWLPCRFCLERGGTHPRCHAHPQRTCRAALLPRSLWGELASAVTSSEMLSAGPASLLSCPLTLSQRLCSGSPRQDLRQDGKTNPASWGGRYWCTRGHLSVPAPGGSLLVKTGGKAELHSTGPTGTPAEEPTRGF